LGVKQAGGQAQQRVHIAFVQQLFADGFARTAFKQHVVGQHHRRAAMGFEQRFDVLHKVQLLVAGGGPKVVALDGVFFGAGAPVFAHDDGAAFLAKRRVGQHHVKPLAGVCSQRVAHHHRHRLFRANAVQQQVHGRQPRRALHQLVTGKGLLFQVFELLARQVFVVRHHMVVRGKQKARRATGRVAHRVARLRGHALHHGGNQGAGREVLARAALGVLRVFSSRPS
jgi:hypothetical protein